MTPPLRHVAIIMDGNRRYAKARGLPGLEGHRAGRDVVKKIGDWCVARQIEVLTLWAFSTENWKRTEEEIRFLMDLLEWTFTHDVKEFHEKGFRLRVIGRREGLRSSIITAIESAEKLTALNTKMTLVIALNYGGRAELVDAFKALVAQGVTVGEITEERITAATYWPEMPSPELIIRTSGEQRLSGFLLWESTYSEIYWCQKHWPEFSEEDLDAALAEYASRERRFGK